jgi:hypothetical protein
VNLFPDSYLSELVPGKDFFYGSELIKQALKIRGFPHPPSGTRHLNDDQMINENGILIDGKDHLVTWHELKLDGAKEMEVLLKEFMEEEGIKDLEFTRALIELIPELYEPGLLQESSAHHGRTLRYVPLEKQKEYKERWKKRRHYLKNKI